MNKKKRNKRQTIANKVRYGECYEGRRLLYTLKCVFREQFFVTFENWTWVSFETILKFRWGLYD